MFFPEFFILVKDRTRFIKTAVGNFAHLSGQPLSQFINLGQNIICINDYSKVS